MDQAQPIDRRLQVEAAAQGVKAASETSARAEWLLSSLIIFVDGKHAAAETLESRGETTVRHGRIEARVKVGAAVLWRRRSTTGLNGTVQLRFDLQ